MADTVTMQRIELEYGEPVRDVIQGLRDQGCAWHTIAGALGVDVSTLTALRRRLSMPVDGTWQRDADREPAPTLADLKAQALGYEDIGSAIRALRVGERLTIGETAQRLGLKPGTVRDRTPRDVVGTCNISEAGKAVQREIGRRLAATRNKPAADHPWRTPL